LFIPWTSLDPFKTESSSEINEEFTLKPENSFDVLCLWEKNNIVRIFGFGNNQCWAVLTSLCELVGFGSYMKS
jgi:hypothetical protein